MPRTEQQRRPQLGLELIAGLAGLAALGSLIITARTYRLTQQSQVTERYTKAVEQLGSDKLDVRLGGVYALERIAFDSKRDYPTAVEVLSAFVREHTDQAHTDSEPSVAKVLSTFIQAYSDLAAEGRPDAKQPDRKPKPPTDVKAAITVLGRLALRSGVPWADVVRRNLDDIYLDEDYEGYIGMADLSLVNLDEAHLAGMYLSGFVLQGAHLEGANLDRAQLEGTYLNDAHLERASLNGARLKRANLHRAHLERASLIQAHLEGANLIDAYLERADLTGTWLDGANLAGAHLERVYLNGDLEGAYLDGAHLEGANLAGADGLTQEQINRASGDAMTRLPSPLHAPAHWSSDVGSTAPDS